MDLNQYNEYIKLLYVPFWVEDSSYDRSNNSSIVFQNIILMKSLDIVKLSSVDFVIVL